MSLLLQQRHAQRGCARAALHGRMRLLRRRRLRGIATVAGVRAVPGHSDFLYLLDRWYTACWQCGQELPAASLGFVGPGYQCYSVSALQEGGVRHGVSVPVLYENQPGPDAEEAWRLPEAEPVLWKPLPGESGPRRAAVELVR